MSSLASRLAEAANRVLGRFGLRLIRHESSPVEFDREDRKVVESVLSRKLSMASPERLFTTLLACRHVCHQGLEGDFVECGVWRGGNSIVAGDVFARLAPEKSVYLFDTFSGMTEPTAHDVRSGDGRPAADDYGPDAGGSAEHRCYASRQEVEANLKAFGIAGDRVRLIEGDVLETLAEPQNLPAAISVLRLDTDWYESTKRELEVLWPRLVPGGVLIVDDYGHWGGAKKAVDEFFETVPRPFFAYTDYTGRVAVKTPS